MIPKTTIDNRMIAPTKLSAAFKIDRKCHDHGTEYNERRTQEQSECHIDTILQQVDITRHTGDHRGSSDRIYL